MNCDGGGVAMMVNRRGRKEGLDHSFIGQLGATVTGVNTQGINARLQDALDGWLEGVGVMAALNAGPTAGVRRKKQGRWLICGACCVVRGRGQAGASGARVVRLTGEARMAAREGGGARVRGEGRRC